MIKNQINPNWRVQFLALFFLIFFFGPQSAHAKQTTRRTNLLEKAKGFVRESMTNQLRGKVISKTKSLVTVQKEKNLIQIQTSEKTEIRRKNGTLSTLEEIGVSDDLLIIGRKTKNSPFEFDASYIRNMSVSPPSPTLLPQNGRRNRIKK